MSLCKMSHNIMSVIPMTFGIATLSKINLKKRTLNILTASLKTHDVMTSYILTRQNDRA
jgi:hypothetical protein